MKTFELIEHIENERYDLIWKTIDEDELKDDELGSLALKAAIKYEKMGLVKRLVDTGARITPDIVSYSKDMKTETFVFVSNLLLDEIEKRHRFKLIKGGKYV